MSCRVRLLLPILVLALAWTGNTAAAAPPAWTLAALPGGRAQLLPRLGLATDLPVALVAGELIRAVHTSRDISNPARDAVRSYFGAPPEGPGEQIPLPLGIAAWRDLLGRDVNDANIIGALLLDRRASMLCYGLLQLDQPTLAAVSSDAGLLRRLYERHSGAFAAFAQVLHIRDGRLVLPGGEDADASWTELIGEPLTDPSRAIAALAASDNGRLLYFADALDGLSDSHLALVFRGSTPEVTPQQQARSVYRAFTRIESGWKLDDFPFVRLGADPALLIDRLRVSPDGHLRHTEDFWNTVLSDKGLPNEPARAWADIDDGDRAEPGWLLQRLTDVPLPIRLERVLLYEFTERLTDRLGGASPADLAWLARAYRRYPALLLSLERLDVRDLEVFRRMVVNAARINGVAGDTASHEISLALFQGPLMLVTRARQSRAIDDATAQRLVATLSEIEPAGNGYGRAIGRWFDQSLLPALGFDSATEGASPEATVLEAVAGLRAPAAATSSGALTWEALPYRVDVAAPELVRLTEVRGLQGGNTLDTALALCRTGGAIAASATLEQLRAAAAAFAVIKPSLVSIEPSERTTALPPPDLSSLAEQAERDLARVRSRADLKRAGTIANRLSRAEDAALADVLTSILYAVWLGDPLGQAFLAGNVARRHDYGVRLLSGEDREQTPWLIPMETSGDGEPWHLRGALLGMDVGLARLALRRTRLDLPNDQPTLNESDRRSLMLTLALTNSADLDQETANRLMTWLREGRQVAASPERLEAKLDVLNLDGRRRQALLWAGAHRPEDVPRLLLRTELVLLGRPEGAEMPAAWGAADTPRSGCLCLEFPAPPALQRYIGRAGSGLLTSRMTDVKLRVLEVLDTLKLPSSLTRGVLASALQDYLDDARPAHGDDWFALARQVEAVDAERFEDYIAALTAGGPLVPLAQPPAPGNGHP